MALLSAHRENLTGLIPCSHAIGPGGKIISDYSDNYVNWRPYLPRVKAMGLKLYAFLGNVGGQGSLAAAMKRRKDFFAEAIDFAKQNQYDGYSSDEELRGRATGGRGARRRARRGGRRERRERDPIAPLFRK